MDSKYLLVSFDDDRIKGISEVLSNDSCKKILNLLADKSLGETEISRQLRMPLNTVGYNIKKLMGAGLIERVNWFWSVKGKKVPVYRVARKSIVISPKKDISRKLGGIIPVVLIIGIAAFLIRAFAGYRDSRFVLADKAAESAGASLQAAAPSSNLANVAGVSLLDKLLALPGWSWFLIGALFALIVYFLLNLTRRYKN